MADEEKQEPAKPKKEKGGLPVPLFGLIGFAIILIALVVNVFLILGIKSDVTAITEVIATGKLPEGHSKTDEKDKKKSHNKDEEFFDDEESTVGQYVADEKAEYFETGRITTNPRASSRFVVLNLGMFFSKYPKAEGEEEEPKEESKEKVESFSPYGKKFDGMVKNIINSQIGSMSLEELQIPRDSLTNIFKIKLRPLFGQQESRLKEVAIIEFIVQ